MPADRVMEKLPDSSPALIGMTPRNSAQQRPGRVSYMELLRRTVAEAEAKRADPMWRASFQVVPHGGKLDGPLREALAKVLTYSGGRERISGREIFWRLRVPPSREACEKHSLARVLHSLGWVGVHYGPQDQRWGWR